MLDNWLLSRVKQDAFNALLPIRLNPDWVMGFFLPGQYDVFDSFHAFYNAFVVPNERTIIDPAITKIMDTLDVVDIVIQAVWYVA